MSSTTAVRSTFPAPSFSDSDGDYDSPTTFSANTLRQPDLSSTIFKSYIDINGKFSPNLTKIKSFLNSSRAGALSCLICLERIKPSDPTWSCTSRCFDVFHLVCIQSWARQSSDLASLRASTRLPISDSTAASDIHSIWNCPKCRSEYPKTLIPKTYYCFCGKVENPSCDPWVLPHSCGEICNRDLQGKCGHYCLLLCHPGPCPSCPQQVRSRCFCGAVEDVRRCGAKNFSCDGICSKELDCGRHRCGEICHEGECPPCRERGVYMCQCGKVEEERECCERSFRCEFPCEKLLGCGKHFCEKGCHKEECGECPFQGQRACPCGRRVYSGMACDSAVQLCGATCDKMLNCGLHRCPERCHRGPCVETCRTVVTKSCRCGSLKKQVPCYQDLACERKCQRLRDCGRHACKRRCCDGDCPPCSEICDRKLRCRNHKCPSPCHRGSCAPCPVMVRISCFCGETYFEVPCGTEREQQPPRCHKPCGIAPLCRHGSDCKPHKCHYGACPPCRLICDEEYPCGHKCNLRCHGPKPPPNPEFTLKPKKKRSHCPSECTPGSPCSPCPEHVWQSCRGHHAGKMMICSDRKEFCCENFCGNLLPCGNHYCTKTCHALKGQSSVPETGESCEACYLPCQKIMMERDTGVPRGFGSQTFVDCRGMEDSIREMHGREFGDKTISVNKAQPRMNGEDAGRDYSGGYLSGGRGSYGEDRSLGKDECFKCGRHGHCALEWPSDGGGREDRYGDRYGNYLLNYRYDGGRYFGDRYEIRETRYGDYVGDPYKIRETWFGDYVGDPYKIRETRFDDYLGYYYDINTRYGDYRGHPYAIRDTRYDDCGADRCKTRETLYGDCYVNNQYDGGRYGYGPYGGDSYKTRETKYGRHDYVSERYQPHSYRFEDDCYGASDHYITSGNGNERLYERDAAPRRSNERYGGLGPARYECRGFRERAGPYDRPNTGQERLSSFCRY